MFTSAPRLAALALALAGLTPSAQALSFVFTNVGGTVSPTAMGALQQAADYWSAKLTDNVTVYINVSFQSLGSNVLGSAGSTLTTASYSALRTSLTSDRTSTTDFTAVASLQAGSALSFMATQGDLSSRLDNDGSTNNRQFRLSTANAKALGMNPGTGVNSPDAYLDFSSDFAFAFTRVGGVPGNQVDFITVAEHELGHALGFSSGVDDIDTCAGDNSSCDLPSTVNRFENGAWYQPLDLFRYSAPGTRDLRVGGSPYFSVDGGATSIESFSTGVENGNGWQASHFGPNALNLMRPFVGNGQFYDATTADLKAFDAIGWDLAVAVPEPESYALLLSGLAVIGFVARRRRA